MAFKRITENDMLGKGNVGKPDTPGGSTSEMQRIMDELPREVIAPAFNELSGQLEANTASADIGANAPDGITPDPAPAENSPAKLQSVLQGIVNKITDHIADQVKHVTSEERTLWNNASNDRHTHDNKSILDGITSSLVGNWNAAFAHVSDAVRHITENERTNWNDKYTKSETDKAINERVVEIGSSDMTKAVYDPETRNLPYIPKIDAEALTLGKNVVLSGTPVSIAYAGTNRIASIIAYGENAQGGTTEAPVALTGVDSVQVCGNNLIPYPYCSNEGMTIYGVEVSTDTSGRISITGTTGANGFNFNLACNESFSLPSGTYSIWDNGKLPTGVRVRVYNPKTGSLGSTFTLEKETGLRIYINTSSVNITFNVDGLEVMLVRGTTVPTAYEPYQGSVTALPIPRPLRRVGDVKDKCVTRQEHEGAEKLVVTYNVGYIESYAGENITTAWISSTGALSTGAEVAYVLSSPETYAADPLDIDNAAGPLTVLTGGELEVRMTELVGMRSDVSNNTVAFSEVSQDADIQTGEKLSVLFGKIKKRLSLLKSIASNRSELDNDYFLHSVNQRGVSGTITTAGYFIDRWKLVSGSVTLSTDGIQLTAGTVIAQILEYAAGTDVIASLGITSGTAAAVYDDASKTYTITATTACTLTWAKLEKGSIATPYVPNGYGAELAECQRYYLSVPEWKLIGSGYVQYDGALIAVMIPTPCTMRTNPSINSISGTFYFGDGTTSSYTGTPGVVSRPGWAEISFTGTFGHQNQTVAFLLSGSAVELSADL